MVFTDKYKAKDAWRALVANRPNMGDRTLANPPEAKSDHNDYQDELVETLFERTANWVEVWQATAINPIPAASTKITFAQVELFPGQPSLFSFAAGDFTAQEEASFRMSLTGELNFTASANNVDATVEINPVSGASSLRLIGDIVESYQSSRSSVFRKGVAQSGLVAFDQGHVFSVTAQEVDGSGAMDASLVELWVIFELFT